MSKNLPWKISSDRFCSSVGDHQLQARRWWRKKHTRYGNRSTAPCWYDALVGGRCSFECRGVRWRCQCCEAQPNAVLVSSIWARGDGQQKWRQDESGLFSSENRRLRGDVTADYKRIVKGKVREEKAYLNWRGKLAQEQIKNCPQTQEKLMYFEVEIGTFCKNC